MSRRRPMIQVVRYYRQVAILFVTEPILQVLFMAAVVVLGVGTVFYHFVEHWGWLDSAYFCTVTLATIGYGDFVPTTAAGKLFTIFYVLFGLGIITTFITTVARAPMLRGRLDDMGQSPGAPDSPSDADGDA